MLPTKLKKTQESIFHHKQLKTGILEHKNQNKESKNRYSGYYIFDVEWIKIKGI